MAYVSSSNGSIFSPVAGISGLVAQLRHAVAQRAVYNQTLRELQGLNARELADMGLHPANLADIALDAARRV
jgi:uncharacterized protein YjiS (DUF1127 family)